MERALCNLAHREEGETQSVIIDATFSAGTNV